MRTQQPKVYGHRESSPKKEVHSITGLLHGTRINSQVNNLILHLKDLEKEQILQKFIWKHKRP